MEAALLSIAILLAVVAAALAAARMRHRTRRAALQERWGLTDDELELYEAELGEVAAGLEQTLPRGTHSRSDIAALAEEATLKAVLLKRVPPRDRG